MTSFDFSATASWPRTSFSAVAKADTRCNAALPAARSWLRLEVLPSSAINAGASSRSSQAQLVKHTENSSGSIRIDPVHQDVEPASAGNALIKRQKAAQKVEMRLAPGGHIVEIVARGDRRADDEQQHLRQGMCHSPLLTRVLDDRKIIQKAGKTRFREGLVHSGGSRSFIQSQLNYMRPPPLTRVRCPAGLAEAPCGVIQMP